LRLSENRLQIRMFRSQVAEPTGMDVTEKQYLLAERRGRVSSSLHAGVLILTRKPIVTQVSHCFPQFFHTNTDVEPHDRNPFQFIIHLVSHYSTLYNLSRLEYCQINHTVKVKFSLALINEASCPEVVRRSGNIGPLFLISVLE
jgi:hypothetical protein